MICAKQSFIGIFSKMFLGKLASAYCKHPCFLAGGAYLQLSHIPAAWVKY